MSRKSRKNATTRARLKIAGIVLFILALPLGLLAVFLLQLFDEEQSADNRELSSDVEWSDPPDGQAPGSSPEPDDNFLFPNTTDE